MGYRCQCGPVSILLLILCTATSTLSFGVHRKPCSHPRFETDAILSSKSGNVLFSGLGDSAISIGEGNSVQKLEDQVVSIIGEDELILSETGEEEEELLLSMLNGTVEDAENSTAALDELLQEPAEEVYSGIFSELSDSSEQLHAMYDPYLGGGTVVEAESFMDNETAANEFVSLLEQAVAQAWNEVDSQVDKEKLLQDPLFRERYETMLAKANAELQEKMEEARSEQFLLANEKADQLTREREEELELVGKRMARATATLRQALNTTKEETRNVERAMEDLQKAHLEMEESSGAIVKALRKGDRAKQALLTGAVLFSIRSTVETVLAYQYDNPSQFLPAAVEGVVALICLFIFLYF